ncbi:methyltransferase domain-containing protein [Streptomyces sp. NPDC087658]|uniref:methyltransferase domain-containing protein n=1 Tax=Streptomyces sp. NPDC087658 TaxID=3365800 RepID=UPI0038274280
MSAESSPAALARQLTRGGHLAPAWREAFTQVDRKRFIPDRVWIQGEDGYHPLDRVTDPDRWHRLAYEDRALVTRVEDDGVDTAALVPSSSASMPRVVATMLDALTVADGMRVLEVGTGTGYNAALLSERLGDQQVVSVEVDPRTADTARATLKNAGHSPTVITGDGGLGCPAHAPYERTIVTYALHSVPYALVEQTAPGGVIVLPWGTGLYNGVLLRLTTGEDGTATGPVIGDSAFMWNRYETPRRDVMATVQNRGRSQDQGQNQADRAPTTAPATATRTGLDPRLVFGDEDATFTAGVLVPDCRYSVGHGPGGEFTLWLADHTTGSWASVDYRPNASSADHPLRQYGPRALWSEVEAAYDWWRNAGSPERTRFGLTVTPVGQHLWLDTPDRPL